MHRYLIVLLAVFTLLSQWGTMEHAYHVHDHDESCVAYISANANGNAITPSLPPLPTSARSVISERLPQPLFSQHLTLNYASRAPPRFL